MHSSVRFVSLLASLGLAMQPLPAAAQEACVTEAEVSAMVVYFVPLALPAIRQSCSGALDGNGFFATGADEWVQRYAAQADNVWPLAKSGFFIFAGNDAETKELRRLSDTTLRSALEDMIASKLAEEVPLRICGRVERVVEALAPLEPGEAGNLVAVIASLTEARSPSICPEQH